VARTVIIEVLAGDPLCFFVRPGKWSDDKNQPKANALVGDKKYTYSTWHIELVHTLDAKLGDLAIGVLSGSKQWKLTPQDFKNAANLVATPNLAEIQPEYDDRAPGQLVIEVYFRPEDEYVAIEWRGWRNAHCQVEQNISKNHRPKFPSWYRVELAKLGELICDV